ncbi:MAG: four helix bundle protein [Candidatus Uhrbacteria bacterium]
MEYDLNDRTMKFSKEIIIFLQDIPKNFITLPIASQLVRSATSIGANYCEADNAVSKKDFVNKIGVVKKEAKETTYWLNLLATALPEEKERIEKLKNEADELHKIFNSIFQKTKNNMNNDNNR